MIAIAGGPALRSIPVSTLPIKFGTNYTQTQRNHSWADLRASLFVRENRNFYYFGHGNQTRISCDVHIYGTNGLAIGGEVLPNSKAFLDSKTIRDQFTFNKFAGARPYRFVFLDGCNTANRQLPEAFGVNKATNSFSYYTNSVTNPSRKRPSAFVGWAVSPGADNSWGTVQNFFYMRSQWMLDWQQNWNTRTLVQALEFGRNSSGWIPSQKFWSGIRVFGYNELRMNEYNQKTDWAGP